MTAILAIIAGFLHGIKEGMVMYPGGVRSFPDWVQLPYHLIAPVLYGAMIWIGYYLCNNCLPVWYDMRSGTKGNAWDMAMRLYWRVPVYIILLAWEASELAQIAIRWNEYASIWPYENVLGVWEWQGIEVYALHAARIVGGTILLYAGKQK